MILVERPLAYLGFIHSTHYMARSASLYLSLPGIHGHFTYVEDKRRMLYVSSTAPDESFRGRTMKHGELELHQTESAA